MARDQIRAHPAGVVMGQHLTTEQSLAVGGTVACPLISEARARKPCLLLAESDPAFAAIYQRFLTRYGYVVDTASGGLECLEKLRRFTPQVVVLSGELLWGGSDGVLAHLREDEDLPAVPVVLVGTDDYAPNRRDHGVPTPLEWPVVQCLREPFSLMALLDSIRSAARYGSPVFDNHFSTSAPLELCN